MTLKEKGQIWLEKLKVKKFAADLKYEKLRPRIFSRGALTFTDDNNLKEENLDNYLLNKRRMHSIDVGELSNYNLRNHDLDNGNFLGSRTNELMVIHKVKHNSTCKRWTQCKREKVMVKSTEDDNSDIMVVPTFLLTYNPKFSKISNETFRSFSAIQLNELYDEEKYSRLKTF
jgi:hypothetical protein